MTAKTLYRFQDKRPEPPAMAETFNARLFLRRTPVASRVLPGMIAETCERRCPNCLEQVHMDHGDRIRCDCGLVSELYGNGLTVWWENKP